MLRDSAQRKLQGKLQWGVYCRHGDGKTILAKVKAENVHNLNLKRIVVL
jgi:hypothetical protein